MSVTPSIDRTEEPTRSEIVCDLCKVWASLIDTLFEIPQVDGESLRLLRKRDFITDCIASLVDLTCKLFHIEDTRVCRMAISDYKVVRGL